MYSTNTKVKPFSEASPWWCGMRFMNCTNKNWKRISKVLVRTQNETISFRNAGNMLEFQCSCSRRISNCKHTPNTPNTHTVVWLAYHTFDCVCLLCRDSNWTETMPELMLCVTFTCIRYSSLHNSQTLIREHWSALNQRVARAVRVCLFVLSECVFWGFTSCVLWSIGRGFGFCIDRRNEFRYEVVAYCVTSINVTWRTMWLTKSETSNR